MLRRMNMTQFLALESRRENHSRGPVLGRVICNGKDKLRKWRTGPYLAPQSLEARELGRETSLHRSPGISETFRRVSTAHGNWGMTYVADVKQFYLDFEG